MNSVHPNNIARLYQLQTLTYFSHPIQAVNKSEKLIFDRFTLTQMNKNLTSHIES